MSLTFNQALEQLRNLTATNTHTIESLTQLIKDTSASINGANENTVNLLYSGQIDDNTRASNIASEIKKTGNAVEIVNSAVGQILVDDEFKVALRQAIRFQIVGDHYGALTAEQIESAQNLWNLVLNGKDGTLVTSPRVENANSLWDIASENYVKEAKGTFRVILPSEPDKLSVFIQSELPELLKNEKISTIEGIPRADLQKILDEFGIDRIVKTLTAQSFTNLAASGVYSNLNGTTVDNFLKIPREYIENKGLTAEQWSRLTEAFGNLDGNIKIYLKEASEFLKIFASSEVVSGLTSATLRRLPVLSILITASIASADASAAEESGNPGLAREIRAKWVVETTGSEVGAFIGGALGVGLAGLFSLSGWGAVALIAVGSIGGAIYGGDGAIDYYEMMSVLSEDQRMDVVVRLEKLFFGSEALTMEYLNSQLNQGNLTFTSIGMVTESAGEIIANVGKELAWRYALLNLNPFVVTGVDYALHNQNGELDWFDADGKLQQHSEEWIFRRAQFLELISIYWRTGDDDGVLNSNYGDLIPFLNQIGDIHWLDLETETELTVDGLDLGIFSTHEVIFGSSIGETIVGGEEYDFLFGMGGEDILIGGEENDHLEGGDDYDILDGGNGNDFLDGGADDDTLNGGEGYDVLKGGKGTDTYVFDTKFGKDQIIDADGKGSIVINGVTLGTLNQVEGTDIIYRDSVDNPKFEVIKINNGTTTDLLISALGSAGGQILVKNWSDAGKNLGITLDDRVAEDTATRTEIKGDSTDSAISLDNLRDKNSSFNIESVTHTLIDRSAGTGRDLIMGMADTGDEISGGSGNDIISGGFTNSLTNSASQQLTPAIDQPAKDDIRGGAGDDTIFSQVGGSVARGGADNDTLYAGFGGYFLIDDIQLLEANADQGIPGHAARSRDEIYADIIGTINFSHLRTSKQVEVNGQELTSVGYELKLDYLKNLTADFQKHETKTKGLFYIGNRTGVPSNVDKTDVSYAFAGQYNMSYNYQEKDGVLSIISRDDSLPVYFAGGHFKPGTGKILEDYASLKGANLYGDGGDDLLMGGMFADYLSGGVGSDLKSVLTRTGANDQGGADFVFKSLFSAIISSIFACCYQSYLSYSSLAISFSIRPLL